MKQFFRYLPIGDREKNWGLYVKAAGFEDIKPGEPFPRTGHPPEYAVQSWQEGRILQDYAAIFVTRGEGQFESKTKGVTDVFAGNVFLLFPGVWHRYRPTSAIGWSDFWVVFNGKNIERLFQNGFISNQNPVLRTGVDELLLRAFVTLLDRLRTEPVGFEQLLAASTMEILATMLAAIRSQNTDSQIHNMICQAKSLLETQGDYPPIIDHLATSLDLSPTHFHRIFKKHTGLTPYQYYLHLQIERAKQMLHSTTMDIKTISAALAFGSPFHFSRAFKLKTGMSPSQWREQGHRAKHQ